MPQEEPASVPNRFDRQVLEFTGTPELRACGIRTLQVNVGLRCNQACEHCHLAASPLRRESMSRQTMTQAIEAARSAGVRTVDLTGGAPELNPHFRWFLRVLRQQGFEVMARTNLTVLQEPGLEDVPELYRELRVHLLASLPCYLPVNVDGQRGSGSFAKSIVSLKRLNDLGYGIDPSLPLDLVYNPAGPSLPPDQSQLETQYRQALREQYGLTFTRLLTITNLPIGRFWNRLKEAGQQLGYTRLLSRSFNPQTVDGLMCRHQLSVRWDGALFDCDFNLALGLPLELGVSSHIEDFDPDLLSSRRIVTGTHCFGCAAGNGSSCGGALISRDS